MNTLGPEHVLVRVPSIPGYNAPEDVARSIAWLRTIGINRIDSFNYIVRRSPVLET